MTLDYPKAVEMTEIGSKFIRNCRFIRKKLYRSHFELFPLISVMIKNNRDGKIEKLKMSPLST